jgi:fucose permease
VSDEKILTFIRDRFTWVAYFMLGYYAYMQAALGPLIPFLRDELHFNYTVSGFYVSAFALGMIIAGLTADRLARRFGRPLLFWGGGAGMGISAICLILGQSTEITIGCTFLMALIGSYLLIMIQATLSDRHGEKRAYALTESNVIAVLAASAAPLLVGVGQAQGWGWRLSLIVGAAAWGLVFIWMWRRITLPGAVRHIPSPLTPLPQREGNSTVSGTLSEAEGRTSSKLPRVFWAYWLVIFFGVAIEWCMIFWSSTYMETVAGLSKEAAATSVSLFILAQVVGRAAGSGLTRRFPSGGLLLVAGMIVLAGFPLYWLGRTPVLNAAGLFLCGLGVANLFPLTLTMASTVGIGNPNAASARISFGSGMAILIAPQILGTVADRTGIFAAYGVVAPFVFAVIGMTWYANRLAHADDRQLQGAAG